MRIRNNMKNTETLNIISKSLVKNMPVSPRRVQLVANFIRGKDTVAMINYLTVDKRKASRYVLDVLKTAVANAQNEKNANKENLKVSDVKVGPGWVLKNRGVPGAKGQFKPMKRRTTNLTITIAESAVASNSEKGKNNE